MIGVTVTIGSFCSGIGGLDLGVADALDGAHAWFAESDPGASAVLAARFPGVPNHGDLTAFDWASAEPVSVLCMGFPCQPFSAAGLQRGTADERHLFPHIVAAMEKMSVLPRMVVVENVPRLVTIQDGEVWRYVQDELMRLGYGGAWRVAPASAVGAPHLRKRVVLVALLTPGCEAMRHVPKRYDMTSGLPTPRARDWKYGGKDGLDEALILLKTPTANLAANGGSQHPDKRREGGHGPTLADEVEHLLPTPRATDGTNGGPNQRGSEGDLVLPSAVMHMLPTPTVTNAHGNSHNNRGEALLPGAVLPEVFGRYAAAVVRWASVVGPPPPPREPSARGGERLSARFVEWMVGLPAGWATDSALGLSNAAVMRCLGNVVVPQFASATTAELLAEMAA